MEKYLVRSSLHHNQEMVVYIEDQLKDPTATRRAFAVEGSHIRSSFILNEVKSGKKIIFSRKEALERLKENKQLLGWGVIGHTEANEQEGFWLEYLRNL